jgi:hypothetical protein
MKSLVFNEVMNYKSWKFHLAVFSLAVIIPAVLLLSGEDFSRIDYFRIVLLLFIQLEIFFMIARLIFKELRPGIPAAELTRTVLSRFLLFMILCFVAALLSNILFFGTIDLLTGRDPAGSINTFFSRDFGSWSKSTIGGLMFGAAIFIFIQWQDALKREQKLREENLIFQNQTLKNQVNPHFLFNSLNTLSGLIVVHPDSAERFILKLSSIYRYILENSSIDSVPLKSEIDFIYDYYFLHEIRDDGKIQLSIDVPFPERYHILPVSLQILVENAVKHNMATRDHPLTIQINIDDQFIIVRNNLQKMAVKMHSTGIGLSNLRERLRLSTGKALIVEETSDEFIVRVPLIK